MGLKKTKVKRKRPPFLVRNRLPMGGIGLLLLLSTYTAKEIFREPLHAMRDSIVEAERADELDDLSEESQTRQVAVNAQITSLRDRSRNPQTDDAYARGELQLAVADVLSTYATSAQHLEKVSDILNHLTGPIQPLRDRRYALKQELDGIHLEIQKDADNALNAQKMFWVHRIIALTGLMKILVFNVEVALWQDVVVKVADIEKKDVEAKYWFWTYVSYGTYFAGWLLSVAGLFGEVSVKTKLKSYNS